MLVRRFGAFLLIVLAACQYKQVREPGSSMQDREERNEIKAPPAIASISSGLAGPESVLYDPEQDVYFISNINGGLLDKDNNGFISRVDANNLAVNLKWVEGGKNGVTLDGPKGMAIAGDTLYVSDVSAVRKFNRRTGAVEGEIALPGATTINDMTTDGKRVWVSDTAVVPASGGTFFASGTDAVWQIENDHARRSRAAPISISRTGSHSSTASCGPSRSAAASSINSTADRKRTRAVAARATRWTGRATRRNLLRHELGRHGDLSREEGRLVRADPAGSSDAGRLRLRHEAPSAPAARVELESRDVASGAVNTPIFSCPYEDGRMFVR